MGFQQNLPSMAKWLGISLAALLSLQFLALVESKSILPNELQLQQGSTLEDGGKAGALISEMDLGDEDQSANIEASILNYLYTKQMLQKLRQQMEMTEPVKKRNYWKQCAFNAVSCFGRRK